jgi:outer membrane protein TolC
MFVMTSLLAGCAVGPDYSPPELSTPQHFHGQLSPGKQASLDNAKLQAWWERFGDEQLARYITIALKQNLDLSQAIARVAQAQAGLGAANAALLKSACWTASHCSCETWVQPPAPCSMA